MLLRGFEPQTAAELTVVAAAAAAAAAAVADCVAVVFLLTPQPRKSVTAQHC